MAQNADGWIYRERPGLGPGSQALKNLSPTLSPPPYLGSGPGWAQKPRARLGPGLRARPGTSLHSPRASPPRKVSTKSMYLIEMGISSHDNELGNRDGCKRMGSQKGREWPCALCKVAGRGRWTMCGTVHPCMSDTSRAIASLDPNATHFNVPQMVRRVAVGSRAGRNTNKI